MAGQNSWEKSLENLFTSLGFLEKEASVYRVLLELGKASVGTIISHSKLKRGIVYSLLYKLEAKGLAKSFSKEGKIYFQAEPPQKLAELAEQKAKEVEITKNYLDQTMPKLIEQYKLSVGKPTIQYYEGKEGLVKVFEDIYAPKDEPVYGAVDVEQIESVFQGLSLGKLIPSRIKNKLSVKCLYNDTKLGRELKKNAKKELRECLLLDPKKYPLPAEIEAYKDKVALMSFKEGEFVGMIIENEEIATTLKSILRFLFDQLSSRSSLRSKNPHLPPK